MSETVTARQLLTLGRERLAGSPQGSLEAEVLLAHVLGLNRSWLYANGEKAVPRADGERYENLVARRHAGEPVAYLTGLREFWSLALKVTPDVLIPRPETELLVETALRKIPADARFRAADLGTGSGAVALAVALERPLCEMHASEIDPAALTVARANGDALLPGRVRFHLGSWFEPLEGRFGLVLSNPPYVAGNDRHLEQGDVRYEPRSALTPGKDGLSAIREIATDAPAYLEPGGCLAFEHGHDQGSGSRAILAELGYMKVETVPDLEKRDRVTFGFLGGG